MRNRQYTSIVARAAAGLLLAALLVTAVPAHAAAPAKKGPPPTGFLAFSPVTVSILERMRVRGLLTVEFGLFIKDAHLRARAERQRRNLNNAYVQMLVDFGAGVARPDAAPDVEALARRMQRVTDGVLGEPGAQVLLTQAQLRRIR